jgi:3-hydroxy acid dehydrogenase/malonic semialdehyde reductase
MNSDAFALITGASAGIGQACAESLAAQGKNLILVARRLERLEALKKKLETEHDITVDIARVDLSEPEQIEQLFKEIADRDVDVLINNAGLALGKKTVEEADWNDFDRVIDVNIKALTRVAQLALPKLRATQGHIVSLSSVAGIEAYEGGSVYCATKAYVKMLSKALRIDLQGTGVRVTDIAPGSVDTEFSTVRFKGDKAKADAVYQGYTPLYAQDIADAVMFALSRPQSVNIEYLLIMPTAQASATRVVRA